MKIVAPAVVVALMMGIALTLGSYYLDPSHGGRHPFLASMLANFSAEFIGTAAALLLGVWLATRLARQKLSDLAEPLLALIQQLREEGRIRPITARKSVIAVVGLLADGALASARKPSAAPARDQKYSKHNCKICLLDSDVEEVRSKMRCSHCKLPGEAWVATVGASGQRSGVP